MSNMFSDLTNDGLEESQDRLGGFRVHDTDIYSATIKLAYAGKAPSSNARFVAVTFEFEGGGEHRETFWVTNKEGKNSYTTKDGKTFGLPGYVAINDLCAMTTNKMLQQQDMADKTINLYSPETRTEVPTSVPMLTELLGKKVYVGLLKVLRNKQKKGPNGYEDTPETREENIVDKFFHYPSKLTFNEAKKQIQDPGFYKAWIEQNKGKVIDRTNKNLGANAGTAGLPPKANNASAALPSLFG